MKRCLCVALLLLLPAAAFGNEVLEGACDIAFHETSTFVNFDGTASCTPFTLALDEELSRAMLAEPGEIQVPIDSMRTGIGMRDKDMRKMFKSTTFPLIRGTVNAFDPAGLAGAMVPLSEHSRLLFDLTMRDVTRPVEARVTRLVLRPALIQGSFPAVF